MADLDTEARTAPPWIVRAHMGQDWIEILGDLDNLNDPAHSGGAIVASAIGADRAANAALIAAAPDLLAALRLTLQALDNLHMEEAHDGRAELRGRYRPLMATARAAICRARHGEGCRHDRR